MDKWTELRTACKVAQLGTVSAAAKHLGVHRATVNRHIDSLEAELGAKIFQRHARGYTMTDIGKEVLQVASQAEELIDEVAGRTRGYASTITGTLIIATITEISDLLMPAVAAFISENPSTKVICDSGEQLARLEHGEAHIAVRAGSRPKDPDYVVQRLNGIQFGLYGHVDYYAKFGQTEQPADLADHRFVVRAATTKSTRFERWLAKHISDDQVVLRVSYPRTGDHAILNGLGIGFMPESAAQSHPSLIPAVPSRPAWTIPLWLVTHVDLHRTRKVQSMLEKIKALDEQKWFCMPDSGLGTLT
ncbi:MAG: LysR family transcriptional regulator [Pseudomonadota bacterium]